MVAPAVALKAVPVVILAVPAPSVVERPWNSALPPLLTASAVMVVVASVVLPPVPLLRVMVLPPYWISRALTASEALVDATPVPVRERLPPWRVILRLPRRLSTLVAVSSSARVPPALIVSAVALPNSTAPLPLRVMVPPLTVSAPVALLRLPVSVRLPVPILVKARSTAVAEVKAPAKVVLVLSAPTVTVAEVVVLLFVIKPPVEGVSPAKEPKRALLALRLSSAPAATTRAEEPRT